MQRSLHCVLLAALIASLAACNTLSRQPRIREAGIAPSTLKPGDTALIEVQVKDPYNIVERIEGVVREDPRIRLELKDDGQGGDKEAGDHVWTLQVDVPFQAPPGLFNLEFTAYRADGETILVRDKQRNTTVLSTTFSMEIVFPENNAP